MSSKKLFIQEHTCIDRTPYTYLIGWSHLNVWYYGVRYGKGCHPSDLWVTYFTSSSAVSQFVTSNGQPNVIEIRKIFNSTEAARAWEDKVHHRAGVVKSNIWLNKSYGNSKFGATNGKMCAKDSSGNIYHVDTDDTRLTSGELVHINKGKRFLEISSKMKNTILVERDSDNIRISKEEFDPNNDIIVTPFRGSVSTVSGMVSTTEYKAGNFKHTNANNSPAKSAKTGESLGRVSNDDPRWKTGEIITQSKNHCGAKDAMSFAPLGNISLDDPRWASGEIVPLAQGTACAKDSVTGKIVGRVSLDDPRWASGEIVGVKKKLSPQPSPIPNGL